MEQYFRIRRALSGESAQLADLWRRSVTATHDFLTEHDIQELYQQVKDEYLTAVEVWVAAASNEKLLGFIGLENNKVEMLFIDADLRGQGIGKALLDFVSARFDTLFIDVNEQNPGAYGFYLHYGFIPIGRSEHDAAGNPFPIIHMKRNTPEQDEV